MSKEQNNTLNVSLSIKLLMSSSQFRSFVDTNGLKQLLIQICKRQQLKVSYLTILQFTKLFFSRTMHIKKTLQNWSSVRSRNSTHTYKMISKNKWTISSR